MNGFESQDAITRERRNSLRAFILSVLKARKLRDPPKIIIHKPVHDIESIYWLVVSFLLRAWPSALSGCSISSGKEERSTMLDALMGNKIDGGGARAALIQTYTEAHWRQLLPAPINRLGGMLYLLGRYFSLTWHHADVGDYELHGHDFMQLAILREIQSLIQDQELDPIGFTIPLQERPLPAYSSFPIANFSTHLERPLPTNEPSPTPGEETVNHRVESPPFPGPKTRSAVNGVAGLSAMNDLSPNSDLSLTTSSTLIFSNASLAPLCCPLNAALLNSQSGLDVLETRISRILGSKQLEKHWFMSGPAPPYAPGYNH